MIRNLAAGLLLLCMVISPLHSDEDLSVLSKKTLHEATMTLIGGQKAIFGLEEKLIKSKTPKIVITPYYWYDFKESPKSKMPIINFKIESRVLKDGSKDWTIEFIRKRDNLEIKINGLLSDVHGQNKFNNIKCTAVVTLKKDGLIIYKIPFSKNKTHIRSFVLVVANKKEDLSKILDVKTKDSQFDWAKEWQR